MKTNNSIVRMVMAVAVAFAFSTAANAQFPKVGNLGKGTNIGKVIKNKAEGTAETMAKRAVDKAEQKARKKMWEIVKKKVLDGKQMPECPWPMQEGVTKSYSTPVPDEDKDMNITWYVTNLYRISDAEVRDMKAKLDARFQANKKILLAKETGVFSQIGGYTDNLLNEVEHEQERWTGFYAEILNYMNLHVQGKVKDITGNPTLVWDFGQIMTRADMEMYTVAKNKNTGKMQFYGVASKQGVFASAKDVALINQEVDIMKKIGILTEGLTTELDDPYPAKDDDNRLAKINFKSKIFVELISQALASNSPENIERRAMPKAGSLNKSLKAKALAVAKADDPSVIDVVITSNNWSVKPLERRTVSGYIIRKDEYGKRATSRSWCQDYMGGGKYGSLRNYGVGMESFYLK